ncbi:hypothetical protein [Tautonia plasticadhaerens]|uniref:Lipoprotein n=1 Tax=Tautonia plasticadhaerens TaxID=2527974 RepID=A0A518H750_9BACT|nr:hypothetical protein [Tautonia plasticadhaerens]QDV36611.1 hypothetical protein ElP_45390 [Tautonia plasticadhaerens]
MTIRRAALAAALLSACAAGCGNQPPPTRSLDEEAARRVLAEALEGWKAGRPHAEPSEADPTLRVADEDWLAGARLSSYAVLPGDRAVGPSLACPVALELVEPGGRRVEKRVTYAVGTDPNPSVIRQD